MKISIPKLKTYFIPLLALCALASCKTKENIQPYAAVETYPNDTTLWRLTPPRAMIVIAHDDDMCAMTGTISLLNKKGWDIKVISLSLNPERDQAHIKACNGILDHVEFYNLTYKQFRNDSDTNRVLYRALPRQTFGVVFNKQVFETELTKQVNEFDPSVIFTLDNDIGAYGHPDHVFISQMVVDLANARIIKPRFIYQSVYTPHMIESIMRRHSQRMASWGFSGNEWENSKRTYELKGLPVPSIQINIISEADEKMAYLKSYNERERKTMGFYIPAFEDYKAKDYFSVFDREFYRVIQLP